MVRRELVLAAASALSASAFLIPAGVTPTTNDFAVSFEDPKNHVVRLPCPGCVFTNGVGGETDVSEANLADDTVWIQGGANDVLLTLAVTDDQRLELNGATIFPVKDVAGAARPIRVVQIPAHASQEEYEDGLVRSSKLDVTESGMLIASKDDFESGDSLTTLRYSIMELESNRMALDDVIIDILTTADNELLIVDTRLQPSIFADMPPFFEGGAEPIEYHTSPMPPHAIHDLRKSPMPHHLHHDQPKPKCGIFPSAVCRLATAIESKVSDIKAFMSGEDMGCGGRRPAVGHVPGHIKPAFLRLGDRPADGSAPPPPPPPPHHHHGPPPPPPPPHGPHGGPPHGPHGGPPPPHGPHGGPPPPPHGGPHHGPHHRPHHGHRHHHSFLRSMAHGFFAVIVPALAGVTVGVTISVVGILIGRALSFFWIQVVRGGRPGYDSVALVEQPFDDVPVIEDKRETVINETAVDAPPQYEDAPPYVTEKIAKDDA